MVVPEAYYGYLEAGFFTIGFVRIGDELVRVGFYESPRHLEEEVSSYSPRPKLDLEKFQDLIQDLKKYLSGRRVSFNYPFRLERPEFERRVLLKVREIPYGETRSYSWVAAEIGRPRAWRAVANALARNPIAIIIPCHRIVRKDGRVAGSGFSRKIREHLLRLEGALP
ncbi:MAG: methylated-DNA--[protein]-cysteine S-methyltransferase [Nitrososphaerota archaeon]